MSNTSATSASVVLSSDDATAYALVSIIRAAVRGESRYAAYVVAHEVTRETVKDHALALAVLAFPTAAPVQKTDGKRTKFGNAVQAAGAGLRRALESDESDESDAKPVNLLTRAGLAASLDDVVAAWTAAQATAE
jgi:hypothetical protein